jgi:hypothetical protein
VGQFCSIIISTTVANPLNLLLSLVASIFVSFGPLVFYFAPIPLLPEDFELEVEDCLVSFTSYAPPLLSLSFNLPFLTKSQAC